MAQYGAAGTVFLPEIVSGAPIGALLEIRTGPTDWALVTEIGLMNLSSANRAFSLGVGVPATLGLSPLSWTYAPTPIDPNNSPSSVYVATAWRTPPVAPSSWLRRLTSWGGASAASLALKSPRGRAIPPSSSLALFLIALSGGGAVAFDYWVEWDQ